jgi:hypothetical protein
MTVDKGLGRAVGASPGHRLNLVEDLETLREPERGRNGDGRLDHRQRDVPEPAERPGPIDGGRLLDLDRHGREAGEVDDHGETDVLPDHDDEDRVDRELGVGEPRSLPTLEAECRERGVEGTIDAEDEAEDVRDGQRAEHDRQEEQGAQHVAALDAAVEREREEQPDDVDDHEGGQREKDGVADRAEGLLVVEDLDEVVEADPLERADALEVGERVRAADRVAT